MAISKKDRLIIFNKFGGRCSYCGCELASRWCVDHQKPVHRIYKTIPGHYNYEDFPSQATEEEINNAGGLKWIPSKQVGDGCLNPENDHFDNYFPACVSCNHYKHSADLESFRYMISYGVPSLNKNSTQYRFGKKFGLIEETGAPVVFYFEKVKNEEKIKS